MEQTIPRITVHMDTVELHKNNNNNNKNTHLQKQQNNSRFFRFETNFSLYLIKNRMVNNESYHYIKHSSTIELDRNRSY